MKLFSIRNLRILILLALLAAAAIYTQGQQLDSTAWLEPLEVTAFPINGDGCGPAGRYIAGLRDQDFAEIDEFMTNEAERYPVLSRRPTHTRRGPQIEATPPHRPAPGPIR